MEIKEIIIALKGQPSPHDLANYKVFLAADYAFLAGELSEILSTKPETWERLREKATSDKQAERAWEKTAEGLREMSIRLKMKAIEKMLSAISTRIQVATEEIRGNF